MITPLTIFSSYEKPIEDYNRDCRSTGPHVTIRNFSMHPLKVVHRLTSSNALAIVCDTRDGSTDPDHYTSPGSYTELVVQQNGWKTSSTKFKVFLAYQVVESQKDSSKKLSTWFSLFHFPTSIVNDRRVSYFYGFSSQYPNFDIQKETEVFEFWNDKLLQLSRYALQVQEEARVLECYGGDSKFAEVKIDFSCHCTLCLPKLTSHMTQLSHPLHEAVLDANAPEIARLLSEKRHSPDSMDFRCRTALHLAAKENFFDIARLLLEQGANKNARDIELATPLIEASFWGSVDVVKVLMNEFAHSQPCNLRAASKCGRIALHEAAGQNHAEIVKLFLERDRTLVNTADGKGYTPLHLASECGSFEAVKLLLDHYADPKLLTSFGATALHLACRDGHTDIVDLLMHRCRAQQYLSIEDTYGFTPMRYTIYTDSLTFIIALEKYGGDLKYVSKVENRTAMHDAAEMGSCALMRYLVKERHCYADATDRARNTPMHLGSFFGHTDLIKLLIGELRASTSILNSQGATAFFLACQQGKDEVVKYFLQVDAYLMHIPIADDGRLPIHYAIYNGHENVVALMIEYGVDVLSSNDARRKTVFDFAVQANRSRIAEMLIKALRRK